MNLLGVEVDFIELRSTPLQMLVALGGLVIAVAVIVRLVAPLLSGLIDRAWPPSRVPSPTELLWGEMERYVRGTFRGLDEAVAQDVATQLKEVKVPAGSFIIQQGDPATHYYWLKSGEADVLQRSPSADGGGEERLIRRHRAGEAFGEVAILNRTARTASVKAVTDCVVMELPADEFISALALSAADQTELFTNVENYLAADRQRAGGPGEAS